MAGKDALPILSTFMICILHNHGRGGGLPEQKASYDHFLLGSLQKAPSYCGVDFSGLISGFVNFKTKPKLSKYIYLWIQIIVLYVWIAFVNECLPIPLQRLFFIKGKEFSIDDWKNAVFPVHSKTLWYFNVDIGLYWFLKLLASEPILDCLNSQITLALIFVTFSLFHQLTNQDYFGIYEGYCTL